MSDPVMESSSLIQCFEYTEKLISQKTPFKLDIKLSNGFVFNMSWDEDRRPKPLKDLKKSPSTIEKNLDKKQKYIQGKQSKEELKADKSTVKHKTKIEIKCEECNIIVNSKNQLESHKFQKHKTNEIFRCEYCKEDLKSKKDLKEHIKLHKTEENEQRSSRYEISQKQIEEQRQKDIESHNEIEELLRQCRRDMFDDNDEDDEVYVDSDSEE